MKDIRDVKTDYGYILRWKRADEVTGLFLYLENIHDTNDREYIVKNNEVYNQEAFDYIRKHRFNEFRDSINLYELYESLFKIMNINKLYTLKDVLERKRISGRQLSMETGIPRMTISDLINGKVDFKSTKLDNALKIAKVCHMTVDELYKTITEKRIVIMNKEDVIKAREIIVKYHPELMEPFDLYLSSGSKLDCLNYEELIQYINKDMDICTSEEVKLLKQYKEYLETFLL